jgi:hypothetical protein
MVVVVVVERVILRQKRRSIVGEQDVANFAMRLPQVPLSKNSRNERRGRKKETQREKRERKKERDRDRRGTEESVSE